MADVGQEVVEIKLIAEDVKKNLDAINKGFSSVTSNAQGFSRQLDDIIQKFDTLANKASTVNKTTNKTSIKIPNAAHTVSGEHGTMTSQSGREQRFRDYQDEIIKTQKAELAEIKARTAYQKKLTADVAEKTKHRSTLADAKSTFASGFALAASKKQDQNSAEFLAYQKAHTDALNESKKFRAYREKHPELFASGGLNASWRHQMGSAASKIGDTVSSLGTGGRIAGSVLNVAGGLLKAPAAGLATALTLGAKAATDFAKAATTAYAEIEATKTQLGVVFSSQTQADSMFGELSAYAVKSPFGVQQTSELAILLKQSGVYASDLMDTLRMLGDTAGGNMEKMKRIANNYAQIVSIGKASMLDMRQFAYAGIPIFEAVSKELGVSQQELRKLISDGKITSDIIEKVFKNLTGINGIFENATEKGARTLKARLQNLADAKQLAMSEAGSALVHWGEQTGNDSYAIKLVAWAENIYSWLKEYAGTKNIERSVKVIEDRNSKIDELNRLIEYNEMHGDKELAKEFREVLKRELAKIDPDAERAAHYAAYKDRSKWISMVENGETRSYDELVSLYKEKSWYASGYKQLAYGIINDQGAYEAYGAAGLSEEEIRLRAEAYAMESASLKELVDAVEKFRKLTEKDIAARKETEASRAQLASVEQTNKMEKAVSSLGSSFQELASIFENSEEEKLRVEKEHIDALKKAQEELRKINENAGEGGTVDITKFSPSDFLGYRRKGAFGASAIKLLDYKDAEEMRRNREVISAQLSWAVGGALSELERNGASRVRGGTRTVESIQGGLNSLLSSRTDEQFFSELAHVLTDMSDALESLRKKAPSLAKAVADADEMIKSSTSSYTVQNKGLNADLSQPQKNASAPAKVPVALWKRIIGQATGLSPSVMTSSAEALNAYHNDVAVRDIASGMFSAIAENMSASTIGRLLAPTGLSEQLPGDYGQTYQVNWAETKKRLQEFATQLSASTDVISAYRSGLESELGTYTKMASALTSMETSDSTGNRSVSAKKYADYLKTYGEQLVNAFGEGLMTMDGRTVYARKKGDDVKFYDAVENGNEVLAEDLKLEINVLNGISKKITEMRRDLAKANTAELNSKFLNSALSGIESTMLTGWARQYAGSHDSAAFLTNNPDYMVSSVYSNLSDLKSGSSLGNLANEDILLMARQGNEEARKLIKSVFDAVKDGVDDLVKDDRYKELTSAKSRLNRDDAVNKRMARLLGYDEGESVPERDGGLRGLRNRVMKDFGFGREFDQEDLYVAAARTANTNMTLNADGTVSRSNDFGIDADKYLGMGADEILETMTEAEKHMVAMKDCSAQIRDAFAEMGDSIMSSLGEAMKSGFLAPFETLGEALLDSDVSAKDLANNMKAIAAGLLKNVGTAMATAGFQIAGAAALSQNWAGVAGGLALAAAGGFASGISNALGGSDDDDDDDDEDKLSKLNDLKDSLADLIKQAREDSVYYESTLRHKKALSTNASVSQTSVNDAIITPQGNVITTHPDDYLIATKTPQSLARGGSPVVNFSMIDKSTGVRVTSQKSEYNEESNSIDIETVIESKIGEFIMSPKGDDAFSAREARISGRHVVM